MRTQRSANGLMLGAAGPTRRISVASASNTVSNEPANLVSWSMIRWVAVRFHSAICIEALRACWATQAASGVGGGRRDDDLAGADVDVKQQVEIDDARTGECAHRDEVRGPECGRVALDELVPGSRAAFGSGVDVGRTKDVDHGRAADGVDAEFLQFPVYAQGTPAVLAGDLNDQLTDLVGRARATGLACGR